MVQLARLKSRALVAVSGPDRANFLQGLITQNVLSLAPGSGAFGALLTPQGKFLFDLFIYNDESRFLLDVEAARRDAFVQKLSLHRLRAKVEVGAVDDPVSVAWGETSSPPAGARAFPDPRLASLGLRLYGDFDQTTADEADWDAHRLGLGVPDPARDCIPDKTFPIEANFDLLNGIDFHKGCFIGQETTSRMKRRGRIKTRMVPIVFEGPPPDFGTEVLAGDLRAGEVLSGIDGRAMALLRLDRLEAGALSAGGRRVAAERPDWLED